MVYPIYEIVKFWLPIVTAVAMLTKAYFSAKKLVTEGLHTLFENHLKHIQDATAATVIETQKTNLLLAPAVMDIADVKSHLCEHIEKSTHVWDDITKTLTVIEDRTRRPA